jgi:hypothetical protein
MLTAGGGASGSEACLHPGEGVGYVLPFRRRLRAESHLGGAQRFRQRPRLSSKASFQRSRALSNADFCKSGSERRLLTLPISTKASASLLLLGDLSTRSARKPAGGRRTGAGPVLAAPVPACHGPPQRPYWLL